MKKQIANLKNIIDADPFAAPLGRGKHSTDNKTERDQSMDGADLSQKRQEFMTEQFADLKRLIDEDPYGVLFGRRLQRTKSPEDVPFDDFTNAEAGKSRGTSSVKNTEQLKDPVNSSNRPHQQANSGRKNEPSSKKTETQSFADVESHTEELEFDPITMRKVPKKGSKKLAAPPERNIDESFSIPVKTFTGSGSSNNKNSAASPNASMHASSQTVPSTPKSSTTAHTPSKSEQGSRAREGFDAQIHDIRGPSPSLPNDEPRMGRKSASFPIESALDRHVMAKKISSDRSSAHSSSLKYPVDERTEDDVDLLRPSDVRASVGLSKRAPRPTATEKQERRSDLSVKFEKRNQELDRQLEEELAAERAVPINPSIEAEPVESSPKSNNVNPNAVYKIQSSFPSTATTDTKVTSESESPISEVVSSSQIEAQRRARAQRAHEAETNVQKAAMEAIEMRTDRESSQSNPQPQAAIESGTANQIDMSADGKSPQERAQQLAEDKAFISEIRSIYEDRYGNIDENHRQPAIEAAENSTVNPPDKTATLENATNERVRVTSKLAHAEGEHQSLSGRGDLMPIRSEQPMSSGDPSYTASQIHELGGRLDMPQQLLREVYQTQNLIRDLNKRISEIRLPSTTTAESLKHSTVPDETFQQSPSVSSRPLPSRDDFTAGKEDLKVKRTKHHTSPESTWNDSDQKSTSKSDSEAEETASIPVSYRILAYDPSSQRVVTAKNTFFTSPANERCLTVAEALAGLANPAKFLPHFASLQNAGYEIVSGSSNLLIFKKTDSPVHTIMPPDDHIPEIQERYSMHTNPIDGTTPQTGNFASPTGFVNYDSILPSPDPEEQTSWQKYPRGPKPSDKVRREEPVFSGSSGGWRNSHDEKVSKWTKFRNRQRRRRRWETPKRMFWVGVWVAGCCYVGGVASETLRGGNNVSRQ